MQRGLGAVELLHGAFHGDAAVAHAFVEVRHAGVEPRELALEDGHQDGAGLRGRLQRHGHQRLDVHLPRGAGDLGRALVGRRGRDDRLHVQQPLAQLAHAQLRVRARHAGGHDRAVAGGDPRGVGAAEGEGDDDAEGQDCCYQGRRRRRRRAHRRHRLRSVVDLI